MPLYNQKQGKKMAKLIDIKKQTNNKYLNMYEATYKNEKGIFPYYIASRREKIEDLEIITHKKYTDAVRFLPYYTDKNGKMFVSLIREFRFAINKHIYAVPAGLIDKGETAEQALTREIMEEVGAKVKNATLSEPASYMLAGMTDECVISYECEIELMGKNHIDGNEEIDVVTIELEKLPEFLDTHSVGLVSRFQLRAFYYKQMLNKLKK